MVSQADYVIAVGIFILAFSFVINIITDYFSVMQESTDIASLRSKALNILENIFEPPYPVDWSDVPEKIGLGTKAYRFKIVLNNTGPNITNYRVEINYTQLGILNIDYNSTYVYSNEEIKYNISSDLLIFETNLTSNQIKTFFVYYDDDSNFTDRSVALTTNPLKYDFGTETSSVKTGYTQVTNNTLYPSYGWITSPRNSTDRGIDDLKGDIVMDNETRTFSLDVPNGTYNVTVWLGDYSGVHANMTLTVNGVAVISNLTTSNEVKELTYVIQVTNGNLNQTISVADKENQTWAWAGFSVIPANLSVTVYPPEYFYVLQYKQIIKLNASDYETIKNSVGRDFHLKLYDENDKIDILNYSDALNSTIPSKGNVIALQKYTIYQNQTSFKKGYLVVYVW